MFSPTKIEVVFMDFKLFVVLFIMQKRWCSLKGYVYRFLNKDEKIIYIGSCGDLFKRLRQHFEHGHLGDYCYDQVLYVDYVEFRSRTEAYMYEQYEIAKYQPEFNDNGKIDEDVDLEYFAVVKNPIWSRLYAESNYGYRYEKVYTNFLTENPNRKEPNRADVMYEAEIMKRFKSELQDNKKILRDMELLQEKCPTYLSLIDKADLEILIQCMPEETVHYSYEDSISSERMSDTDYDVICIDKIIKKSVDQLNSLAIHKNCGMLDCSIGDYTFDFPYTKQSDTAYWIPALNDKSLQEIENKAVEILSQRRDGYEGNLLQL